MSATREAAGVSTAHREDVLVVGAGPVGLTLAAQLSRRGVRCRIIDQEEGLTPVTQSRALGIHARTLEVLEGLGVTAPLVDRGRRIQAVNVWDHGQRLTRFEPDFQRLATPYPFVLSLPQGETERQLAAALAAQGTEVQWNTRLIGLSQDDDGVNATVRGSDGVDREMRTMYLAGCDGAHSTVRDELQLSFEGQAYEDRFLLADVHLRSPLAPSEAHVLLTPDGPVPTIPLPQQDCWRLIDTTGKTAAEEPAEITARFEQLLEQARFPSVSITTTVWASAFRIHRRATDQLRVGRCFLAGDAAHIHSPVGGQGMNAGIQDAHNLGWKLSLVVAGAAPDSLLDSYEAERLPVARSVARRTHWATRAVVLRNPLARAVRNQMLPWLLGRQSVQRRLARELSGLGVNYRDSPVVAGDCREAWEGPQPGDRVPDVRLPMPSDGIRRLFDVLQGTHHTLLCFDSSQSEQSDATSEFAKIHTFMQQEYCRFIKIFRVKPQRDAAGSAGDVSVLIDSQDHLHAKFHADQPCLYLIRPDGYVGYRSRPPEASKLRDYLQRVLKW